LSSHSLFFIYFSPFKSPSVSLSFVPFSLFFFLVFLSSLVFSIFSCLFLCFSTLRIPFLFFFHLFVLSSSQKCHSHHFFYPGLIVA
jgi:hypothetical protein